MFRNFLCMHCFEIPMPQLIIMIQFHFEICLDFEKVFFTKILDLKKPYNFCVCSKPSSAFNLYFFLVESVWPCTWVWVVQARIFVKTKAFGALFLKNVHITPSIFNFLQLCSFNFSQIRPLKASKYRFQITAQFLPELAVLVLVGSYVKFRIPYLKRSQP